MFCPKCGASNPDGAKFCAGCGATLEAAPSGASAAAPSSFSTSVTKPAGKSKKRGVVVGVVAVAVVAAIVLVVYNVFFAARAFQGDISFVDPNSGTMNTFTIQDGTFTLNQSNGSGSGSITVPYSSTEARDGGTAYLFENVTLDSVTATGGAQESLNYYREHGISYTVSGEVVIPNAASKGQAVGSWSANCHVDYTDAYGESHSYEFTGRAEISDSGMASVVIPNATPILSGSCTSAGNNMYTLVVNSPYTGGSQLYANVTLAPR